MERAREHAGAVVFHAGTAVREGRLVAQGGRVLNVGATGPDLATALRLARLECGAACGPSKQLRTDIGRRLLEKVEPAQETGSFRIHPPD